MGILPDDLPAKTLRGATVDASAATFVAGTKDDLGNGALVQIQGAVRGDVFRGETVEFLKPEAARALKLNGELRDQSRSVLSKQTIEHLREGIQDYRRRQRLVRQP